jgi:error-prone DNA polymerase
LRSEELAGVDASAQNARLPRVTIAGLVLVRQRPGTGDGVIFMTLEDETGIANVIVWPKIFERLRPIVIGARFVAVTGRLQNEAGVIHVIAERIVDLTASLSRLATYGPEHIKGLAHADEVGCPKSRDRHVPAGDAPTFAFPDEPPAAAKLHRSLPKGRNFH